MRSRRFTIAGMMAAVLVCALGLAALKTVSILASGSLFFVTCGVLTLASIGAVRGEPSARACWLGFSAFGWGYLVLTWASEERIFPPPPTIVLLNALMSMLGASIYWADLQEGGGMGGMSMRPEYFHYMRIGNCFFTLIFALLGGLLSHVLFPDSTRPTSHVTSPRQQESSRLRWWRQPLIFGPPVILLYVLAAIVGARTAPGLWAGVTILLTWASIALMAVAAVGHRGRRRAASAYLAAAVFGSGFLSLIREDNSGEQSWPLHATDRLLTTIRPWLPLTVTEYPGKSGGIAEANARAFLALQRQVSAPFPEPTPLKDVLKSLQAATRGPDGKEVLIYVDPVGLQEAEKTLESTVSLDLQSAPLRTSLHLVLSQLGMTFGVKDGVIFCTCETSGEQEDASFYQDPFLVTGRCVLALLAACLGGTLAPLLIGREDEVTP